MTRQFTILLLAGCGLLARPAAALRVEKAAFSNLTPGVAVMNTDLGNVAQNRGIYWNEELRRPPAPGAPDFP